ncbi:MAG: glycosyltransferase family 4 protein [Oscillospiraceae bacterium]|nr:glycosyltransferase family 4 protein [Oscillospiraceae bacterium]
MSKRILIVSQHFWPESFRVNDICDGFIERGYDVEVLCGIPNYPAGQFFDGYGVFKNRRQVTDKGVKIRRCFEIKRGNNSNLRIFLNYISFPFSSLFSLPYLMRQKYDKIYLHNTSPVMMSVAGILLGRIKKIETTMYVLDLWPENLYSVLQVRSKLLRHIAMRVSNWHYRKTDRLIANSSRLRTLLIDRIGKAEDKVTYIPQFCEKVFENVVTDDELSARFSSTFNMVFTGNISPAQSFETVIRAADLLKDKGYNDIRWIIIGDGMSLKWLKDEVEKAGLTDVFVFIGRVPIEDIPKYTGIADGLFACLNKTDMLDCTLPAKVFSYYAAERPIVLAMDGEIQEIIRESGAGFAVDAEDSEGLSHAVEKLYLLSEKEQTSMGLAAKEYYFKHFERNMNMDKLVAFIES